jgi:hypothetical protein
MSARRQKLYWRWQRTYCLVELALEVSAGTPSVRRLDVVGIEVEHGCEVRDGLIQPAQLLEHSASAVQRVHIAALILQHEVVVCKALL